MQKPNNAQYEQATNLVVKSICLSLFPVQPSVAYKKTAYDHPLNSVFLYWKELNKTKHGLDPEVNKRLQNHPDVQALRVKGRVVAYVGTKKLKNAKTILI